MSELLPMSKRKEDLNSQYFQLHLVLVLWDPGELRAGVRRAEQRGRPRGSSLGWERAGVFITYFRKRFFFLVLVFASTPSPFLSGDKKDKERRKSTMG